MNPFKSAMLTVAGANRSILRQAPNEETKQAALGGAILTTAVLAALSGTLALHIALDAPVLLALLGGIAWGIGILNLDRWLVVSTPRQHNAAMTLMMALPRVLVAIIIGVVVSTPLTLQIFQDEIDAQLKVMQADELASFEERMDSDPRFAGLPADRQRIRELQQLLAGGAPDDAVLTHPEVVNLQQRLDAVEADYRQAELDVACEKEGTCGSGRAGAGPAAADKEARRDRLAAERETLRADLEAKRAEVAASAEQESEARAKDHEAELAALQKQVADAEAARQREVDAHAVAVAANDGLLARVGALHAMERADSSLRTIHLCLFIFLTVLECLPVLFKTLLSLGRPSMYEWLVRKEEERIQDRLLLRLEVEYDEAHVLAEAARDAARTRAATQLDAENRTAKIVLQAQVDLATAAVERWKEMQAERLADEISEWLRTTDVNFVADLHRHSESGTASAGADAPGQPGAA